MLAGLGLQVSTYSGCDFATLINIQTQRHTEKPTERQFFCLDILLAQSVELKINYKL